MGKSLYVLLSNVLKKKFKTKIDTSSCMFQLHAMLVFPKNHALLGVLIITCLNLIFSINTTIPPKGIYDFLPFLCHYQSIFYSLSVCLSVSEIILFGGYFSFRHGKLLHRIILLQEIDWGLSIDKIDIAVSWIQVLKYKWDF